MKGTALIAIMATVVGVISVVAYGYLVWWLPPVLPTSQVSSNQYNATLMVGASVYAPGATVEFRLVNNGTIPLKVRCEATVERLVGRTWERVEAQVCPDPPPVLATNQSLTFSWTARAVPGYASVELGQYRALVQVDQGEGTWTLIVGFRLTTSTALGR